MEGRGAFCIFEYKKMFQIVADDSTCKHMKEL